MKPSSILGLAALGVAGLFVFSTAKAKAKGPLPKEGDTIQARNGDLNAGELVTLRFQRKGAGFAWVPMNEALISEVKGLWKEGAIFAIKGRSNRWFSGLNAFVEVV